MDMLTEAIKFGMQIFVQLPQLERYQQFDSWMEFEMRRLESSLRLNLKYPWAAELFFKFRNDKSQLGEQIRALEQKYTTGMGKGLDSLSRKKTAAPVGQIRLLYEGGVVFWIFSG